MCGLPVGLTPETIRMHYLCLKSCGCAIFVRTKIYCYGFGVNHWLLKTEPDCYSWDEMEKDGKTFWDGIHNYQARNNLRIMKQGDLAFFYHTGGERRILGVVEIAHEAYPDKTDPVWTWVDVQKVRALKRPVTLDELKVHPALAGMNLLRQGRLSVVAITEKEWEVICGLERQ